MCLPKIPKPAALPPVQQLAPAVKSIEPEEVKPVNPPPPPAATGPEYLADAVQTNKVTTASTIRKPKGFSSLRIALANLGGGINVPR